jgi:hypothetical protein
MDLALLYGEMAASALIHAVIPLASFSILSITNLSHQNFLIILIAICVCASFISQFGMLTALQQNSCGGIKNFGSIAKGAGVASVITLVMILIPILIESMRLMVTNFIGIEHRIFLKSDDAANQEILLDSATKIFNKSLSGTPVQPTEEEVEQITRKEIAVGGAFWMLFAGAYGVASGAIFAGSSCG